MVLITQSTRMWLVGLAVSLGIFLLVYFTVIQPSTNTANQALKTGLQQSQQAINQAQRQLSTASAQAGTAASQAAGVSSQASQQISNATKLASCVTAAGTDTSKIAGCESKFGH